MGKVALVNLDVSEETLDVYRDAARRSGRSLEDELREVIERGRPVCGEAAIDLARLSRELRAMTPPDGPAPDFDSTLLIRWDRDTDHGRWLDDGWADHVSRR